MAVDYYLVMAVDYYLVMAVDYYLVMAEGHPVYFYEATNCLPRMEKSWTIIKDGEVRSINGMGRSGLLMGWGGQVY